MNIGATIAAKPTPIPPTILARTRIVGVVATEQPNADSINNKAENNRIFFRPNLSANQPETAAPTTHPTKAELIIHPSMTASK